MKTPNYKVWCGGRGKIFTTVKEAEALADHIYRTTGHFVAITHTKAKATHIYKF